MIERPLTEALNMGRLALDIAGVLGVGVSVEVRAALGAEYTPSSAAQAAYFEERAQMARNGGETSAAAEAMFERAIALDPRYARPYVVLSHCYYEANLPRAITDVGPRAVAAARRAVELDDRLALAHRQLALATFIFRGDSKEAVREFRRAVELNPSDFSVQSYFANFLSSLGELEEAKRHVAVGHELSPFDGDAWGIDGMVHYYAREYDQAEAECRGLELAPRFNRYVGSVACSSKSGIAPARCRRSNKRFVRWSALVWCARSLRERTRPAAGPTMRDGFSTKQRSSPRRQASARSHHNTAHTPMPPSARRIAPSSC